MKNGTDYKKHDDALASILMHYRTVDKNNRIIQIRASDMVNVGLTEGALHMALVRAEALRKLEVLQVNRIEDITPDMCEYESPVIVNAHLLDSKKQQRPRWKNPAHTGRFSYCEEGVDVVDAVHVRYANKPLLVGKKPEKLLVELLKADNRTETAIVLAEKVGSTAHGVRELVHRINKYFEDVGISERITSQGRPTQYTVT